VTRFLPVCPSRNGAVSKRIKLFFCTEAFLDTSSLAKNQVSSKIGYFTLESRAKSIFLLAHHGTSTVAGVVSLVRPTQVYDTERSPSFAAH